MVRVVVRDQTAVKVAGDATKVVRITVGPPINLGNATSGILTSLADVNSTTNRSHGTILQWDSASNKFIHISFDSASGGTRSKVSATDAGGDGSFSYDSGTGVFTYTGPSATDVRAHLVAGTNITYDSATGVISSTASGGGANTNQGLTTDSLAQGSTNLYYRDSFARNAINVTDAGGLGSVSYDSPTGILTYTGPSTADVRNQLVAGTGITYDSASGVISTPITQNNFDSTNAKQSIQVLSPSQGYSGWNAYLPSNTMLGMLTYNENLGEISYFGPTIYDVRNLFDIDSSAGSDNLGSLAYNKSTGRFIFPGIYKDSIRSLFSADGDITYNASTGVFSVDLTNATTIDDSSLVKSIFSAANSGSGSGSLSYNNGIFTYTTVSDSDIRSKLTAGGDLAYDSVSGNISFTQRTDSAVRNLFTASGTGLTYDSPTGTFTIDLSSATTIDDSALVKSLFSVQPSASGFGDLTYNSSNGVFTFTKVTDSNIHSVFEDSNTPGGFGSLQYNPNTGVFGYSGVTAIDIRAQFSAGGDLIYDQSTGEFSFSHPTMYDDSDARKSLTATNVDPSQSSTLGSGNLSYDSVTGVFTFTKVTDSDIRSAINLVDVSGDGSLTYDSAQGILTYIGPSPGEVRAHLAATTEGDIGSIQYDSSAGNIKYNLSKDSIRGLFLVNNPDTTNSPGLVYDSATGTFTHYADFTQVSIRGLISVDSAYKVGLGRLAYFPGDSLDSGGVFQYTGPTADSINQILFGGPGNITDSNLSPTGVDSGTYGSASQIPVFTVNSKGRIDSAGSVAVAGVSGVNYDSTTGLISVTTSAGTTFSDSFPTHYYYTDNKVDARLSSGNVGNVQITGYLRGPTEFIIDPATHGNDSGTLKVLGNLQVEGTTTTINSTTLSINDKNIIIADSAADSTALNGGGITWGGDSIVNNPSITYTHLDSSFHFNRPINVANPAYIVGSWFNQSKKPNIQLTPPDKGNIYLAGSNYWTNQSYLDFMMHDPFSQETRPRMMLEASTAAQGLHIYNYHKTNQHEGSTLYLDKPVINYWNNETDGGLPTGYINFRGLNKDSDLRTFGQITVRQLNNDDGAEKGIILFEGADSGNTFPKRFFGMSSTQFQIRNRQQFVYERHPWYGGNPGDVGGIGTAAAHMPTTLGWDSQTSPHSVLIPDSSGTILLSGNGNGRFDALIDSHLATGYRTGNISRTGYLQLRNEGTDGNYFGPEIYLDKRPSDNSTSDWDYLGALNFRGENSAQELVTYSTLTGRIADQTDGTEDGRIEQYGMKGGAWTWMAAFGPDAWHLGADQYLEWYTHNGTSYDVRLSAPTPSADIEIILPDSSGTLVFRDAISGNIVIDQSDSAALKTNFINNVDSNLTIQTSTNKGFYLNQSSSSSSSGFVHTNTNNGSTGVSRINRHRTTSPAANDVNFVEYFQASNSDGTADHTYASMWGQSGPASSYGALRWFIAEGSPNTATQYLALDGQNKRIEAKRHLDADSATFSAKVYATDSLWAGKGIMFEGTVDSFQTHLNITNPTADRQILLPDSSGTLALVSQLGGGQSDSVNFPTFTIASTDNAGTILNLKRTDQFSAGTNNVGSVSFIGHSNNGSSTTFGIVETETTSVTAGSEGSLIKLHALRSGNSEVMVEAGGDNVKLNSQGATKLQTTPTGVEIFGVLDADSATFTEFNLSNSMAADSSVTISTADSGHIIDQFPNTTHMTLKYLVQSGSTGKYQSTELLVLNAGSAAYITQGPTLRHGMSGDSYHTEFDVDIVGSTVKVKATTTQSNTTIKYHKTAIKL